MVHYPNEDRDIMRLLVNYGGDVVLGTVEVSDFLIYYFNIFIEFISFNLKNQETAVHYCSKSGNTNVLQEIIGQLQPIDAQMACNRTSKVSFFSKKIIYLKICSDN